MGVRERMFLFQIDRFYVRRFVLHDEFKGY
jgi:hypothetical protein